MRSALRQKLHCSNDDDIEVNKYCRPLSNKPNAQIGSDIATARLTVLSPDSGRLKFLQTSDTEV
jgi:hypothetical protein